jgi:hypothetical protein
MDQVNSKLAVAALALLGILLGGQANAQLFSVWSGSREASSGAVIAAEVDSSRGRCGLGTLPRSTSARMCETFVNYGRTMDCAANDLENSARELRAPALAEVASCYRRLGELLVSGRGSTVDQVNALEDVCHQLRHSTLIVQRPLVPDLIVAASNLVMPEFSRMGVVSPVDNPLQAVRLHDLPECARSVVSPSVVNARLDGTGSLPAVQQAVTTASVNQAAIPVTALVMPANLGGSSAGRGSISEVMEKSVSDANAPTLGTPASPRALAGAGVAKGSPPISESAVIGALPGVLAGKPERARKTVAKRRVAPSTASAAYGYGPSVLGGQSSGGSDRKVLGEGPGSVPGSTKAPIQEQVASRLSAAVPPGLPLTGPPPRPQLR